MAATASHASDSGSALALVRELVEIETPSGDHAASRRITALLAERMRALGGSVELQETENGVNLRADLAGLGEPLLLIGHTDTVWPVGALAGDVPWRRDGDEVAGPGAFDMKAGIAIMLAALAAVDPGQRRSVRIVLVCDEEIGSPTSQGILRQAAEGCVGALGFEAPHPDGSLKMGRRGSVRLALGVRGRASHAALDPEQGVSAIDELVDQLVRVRAIAADPESQPVLCNVGAISGGTRANVVPDRATAEIGLRFAGAASEDRVLARLRALEPIRAGAEVEVTLLSHRPTWEASAADAALLDEVRRAAAPLGQAVDASPAAGAGDTNLVGSLGMPTLDGLGPRGGGAHAVREHFLASSLAERIALVTELLRAR